MMSFCNGLKMYQASGLLAPRNILCKESAVFLGSLTTDTLYTGSFLSQLSTKIFYVFSSSVAKYDPKFLDQ